MHSQDLYDYPFGFIEESYLSDNAIGLFVEHFCVAPQIRAWATVYANLIDAGR
jgi:hypothetical protein